MVARGTREGVKPRVSSFKSRKEEMKGIGGQNPQEKASFYYPDPVAEGLLDPRQFAIRLVA